MNDIHKKHAHYTAFTFGDLVYLKTDANQEQWMVTDIELRPNGVCIYTVACGSSTYTAYDFEMSNDANESKKLGL